MNSCVFTGSFDPFTIGHLDIAKRAAKIFDKVYVAVLKNEFKETMFNMQQREEIVRNAINGENSLDVVCFNGLAVDITRQLGSSVMVRGIRNGTDLDYEKEIAFVNKNLDSSIETVFIISQFPQISSTAVRQLISLQGDLKDVLTEQQINTVNKFMKTR